MKNTPSIEILESRIAPASVFHYTDVDGDKVTITSSLGNLGAAGVVNVTAGQLQLLDLSGGGFDGANLTFSVAKAFGGDGLANVGYINSTGHDLGIVRIKGDLGQIDAGDATFATPGLKALIARSLGRLGTDTQGGGGSLQSDIAGALGALVVVGDVKEAFVRVVGGLDGKIGAIIIGGSLIGGSNDDSGEIFSSGDMGAVKIGHDVQGGSGSNSGFIKSVHNVASVSIGGSLLGGGSTTSSVISGAITSLFGDLGVVKIGHDVQGGSGVNSGIISSGGKLAGASIGGSLIGGSNSASGLIFSFGNMGAVKVGHDVQGGSGFQSGFIDSTGKLAGVSIGGSLIGGSNRLSGEILSGGDMGAVKISHDLTGGSITGSAVLESSGVITSSAGRIASVSIGGSIISGIDDSSGALTNNATIRAANDIGSLTVKGSLIGHGNTGTDASPVIISARGQAVQGATTDLAIGKINIGGRVEFANILAGYDTGLTAVNGDAQIGAVKVGGDWAASNLVAGTKNLPSSNTKFGDANDASIGAGSAGIIAKIASITIGGQLFGTPDSASTTDHFGFVAEQIGVVKIGGNAIALAPGAHNDNLATGQTNDVNVHEV
jgi:hypothetical protein